MIVVNFVATKNSATCPQQLSTSSGTRQAGMAPYKHSEFLVPEKWKETHNFKVLSDLPHSSQHFTTIPTQRNQTQLTPDLRMFSLGKGELYIFELSVFLRLIY